MKQKCVFKKITTSKKFVHLREKSLENIKTDKGILLRKNRSISDKFFVFSLTWEYFCISLIYKSGGHFFPFSV